MIVTVNWEKYNLTDLRIEKRKWETAEDLIDKMLDFDEDKVEVDNEEEIINEWKFKVWDKVYSWDDNIDTKEIVICLWKDNDWDIMYAVKCDGWYFYIYDEDSLMLFITGKWISLKEKEEQVKWFTSQTSADIESVIMTMDKWRKEHQWDFKNSNTYWSYFEWELRRLMKWNKKL